MENHNSNNSENSNQISASEIKSAVQAFLEQKPKESKLAHKDILNEILTKLEPVDFCDLANVTSKNKLRQKHEIVLCVEQVLKTFREKNFDLAKRMILFLFITGNIGKKLMATRLKIS